MVSTSTRTSNLHSRCILKEGFIRLMRAAKNGDVRCNDSFLVLLWSTLRRMICEKRSFFTVFCVVTASGILKNGHFFPQFFFLLSSLFVTFLRFLFTWLELFLFDLYFSPSFFSPFLIFLSVSLPRLSSFLSTLSFFYLSFFCPFAFLLTVLFPFFLIYFYLFLVLLFHILPVPSSKHITESHPYICFPR
jgi:hypothetical protein